MDNGLRYKMIKNQKLVS